MRQILTCNVDGDDDQDLFAFASSNNLQFLRNTGGNVNHSKSVQLVGRVSNKTGIGAKIDMRAGSLTQKLESYSASPMHAPSDIHFGLGQMDINSVSPDAEHPLPFRQMKKYPYGVDEQFPMTEEKRRIYDEFMTRSVRTVFPRIEASILK